MPARRRERSHERGAALVAVMLLTALMFALGVFGARTAQIEMVIAGNDLQSKRALEVASAGLDHALALLRTVDVSGKNSAANGFDDELSGGGTGGGLASLGSTATLGGKSYRFRTYGGVSGDGYYVRAFDDVDESAGFDDPTKDTNFRIHLISRGRVGRAERVVQTTIERDATFACALCGKDDFPVLPTDVTLVGALRTDSFDSRVAPYSLATSGTAGHVMSNGSVSMVTDILGLLPINIRGNVRAGLNVVSIGAVNVSGSVTQNAPPLNYPSVNPCGPPYPPNTGMTGGGTYIQSLGTLVNVGVNSIIDFAPGDYCFSSIVMTGASRIRTTGPVRIFLTAPSVIAGIINGSGNAADLRIYSSVSSPVVLPVVPGLVIAGGVQAAAAIYAPDSVVTLAGLTDYYGSIVAAVIPNAGVGGVHYDTALENPGLKVVSWSEERDYLPE
jgi:Tfp pilus assembly protein PilX